MRSGCTEPCIPNSVRVLRFAAVVELIDVNLLIAACCDQAELAQRLAPQLHPAELLDRAAAAIGCLQPRLPDAVLDLAMRETARRLHWAAA